MVTTDGALIMASHPEFLSAGLKAFRNEHAMEADIKLLMEAFPPGVGRTWICVNEGGDLYTSPTIGDDFDVELLEKHARDIYEKSDHNLPHTFNYAPFMDKYVQQSAHFCPHYKGWLSVTTAYLTSQNIPITMEPKEYIPKPVTMPFTLGKKRKLDDEDNSSNDVKTKRAREEKRQAPQSYKECTNENCAHYRKGLMVKCATKRCNACMLPSLILRPLPPR